LAITAGPDGALWFTEMQANRIGRIAVDGTVTEFALPDADARAGVLKTGPDGALWFSESVPHAPDANGFPLINRIGRMTTTGEVTEYALPPSPVFQGASSIAAGPDGAMWFTEYYKGCIGRIDMDGKVVEYGTSGAGFPTAIATGPDGALWFLESSDVDWINTIGRMTTAGEFTQYRAPVQNISGGALTLGPDGALWFTDSWPLDPAIVRLTVTLP
jgi:virginiamycin B lyase